MDVRYADKKLERLCTDEREMRRKRSDIATKLQMRIKALEASPTLGDLQAADPLGKWHPLTADLEGMWSGRLSRNDRILVRPGNTEDPVASVTVTVIDIKDYH